MPPIRDPARRARVRQQLLEALDELHLESKLVGAGTGNAQALIANAVGTALKGEAMWARSVTLFDRVLAEQRAQGVQP